MNLDTMTKKSQEAFSDAHALAVEYHHQELQPLHLFSAMIRQKEGMLSPLRTI